MRSEGASRFAAGVEGEKQVREDAAARLNRFLEKIGLEKTSDEQRERWLKETDFDAFMDMLFVMNGILAGQQKFQRWEGKITKSMVTMGGLKTEDPDLEPPEQADKEFKKVFEEAQKQFSAQTKKVSAAKLYTGIIFAHMFHDGNGRLARNLYAVMTTGKKPAKEITLTRGRATGEFAFVVSGAAYKSLVQKEGLDPAKYSEYVATRDGISTTDIDVLKYIAARRVLQRRGVNAGDQIELTELDESTAEDFKREYENVRREMFWETQQVVEEHADWATEQLDKIIAGSAK